MYGTVDNDIPNEVERGCGATPTARLILKALMVALALTIGVILLLLFFPHRVPSIQPFDNEPWSPKCNSTNEIFVDGKCQDRGQYLIDGYDRVFVFENHCPFEIWVAGTMAHDVRPELTGWHMDPHTTVVHSIPGEMPSIRYWARTNCNWTTAIESQAGHAIIIPKFVCETGDCGNALNRYGIPCMTGSGLPPATLVEFSLSIKGNDFYDLSNVDGYNVGVMVEPVGPFQKAHLEGKLGGESADKFDCGRARCVMDTTKCPPELKKITSSGTVVCLSICKALFDDAQRAAHPILQELYTKRTERGWVKDFLCCDCGEGNGLCEALGSPCTYGCSPFVDNYVDSRYKSRFCDNINGTYLPAWPPASTGENYAAVFSNQCPLAYSWQFNDDQSTYQCHLSDYRITFYVHNNAVLKPAN